MANEEVNDKLDESNTNERSEASRARVKFIASMMDAYLQDFNRFRDSKDRSGCIVAAARLAQLGQVIQEEFADTVNAVELSETDLKLATKAAAFTLQQLNNNARECMRIAGDDLSDGAGETNGVLN